jgi:LmbE family N-acetylglucosaminyl deacetylase
MGALLLAPHGDDETLFASFLCLRYRPRVIVCTTPRIQEQWGVFAAEREAETEAAMKILGCEWVQLSFLDTAGAEIRDPLAHWLELDIEMSGMPDVVIAPSCERDGQEQHNAVAVAAIRAFGANIIRYLTYTRSGGRSRDGTLVEPDQPEWISLKLQALACYRSQMRVPNCRSWFEQPDLREWIA